MRLCLINQIHDLEFKHSPPDIPKFLIYKRQSKDVFKKIIITNEEHHLLMKIEYVDLMSQNRIINLKHEHIIN